MKSKLLSLLLVGMVVALSIITVSTTVVMGSGPSDFGASKDTYIHENTPTSNYGTEYHMWLQDRVSYTRRGLISFATTTIPVGDAINSAYLQLYIDGYGETDPAGKNIRAYILTRPQWHETQANWNIWKTGDNWTIAGGDYDSTPYAVATVPAAPSGQWMYWDMTYILRQVRLAYPGEDLHLLLRFEDEGLASDHSRISFRTKDYPIPGSRPNLHVEHSWMADPTVTMSMLEMGFTDGLFRVHYELNYEWSLDVSVWHSEVGSGVWHQTGPVTVYADGFTDFNVTTPPLDPNERYEVYAMIEWGVAGVAVTHPPIVVSTLLPPEIWVYVHSVSSDEATIRMFYIRQDADEIDLYLGYRELGDPFWSYAAPLTGVTDMSGTHYFNITGLLATTTYEFIGEADYEIEPGVWDTVLTAVDTFTTPVDADTPIITIYEPVFSIAWDMQPEFSAYVWLGIHPTGEVWFEYRRTAPVGPWIRVPLPPMDVILQESYPSHIVEDPPLLLYGEDYEVRGVLDYGAGVLYSDVRAFTMPGIPPSVEILPATDITATSANIRVMLDVGHFTNVEIWFHYREVGESWSLAIPGGYHDTSVPVSTELTGLTRDTEYEYIASAYWHDGVQWRYVNSDIATFTTLQTTQGWFESWLDMIRMNDEAGRIMFALFFILLIPAGLYFALGGLLIPLIAATASLSFFAAIEFIPLWLIILLILIIVTGFFRLVKGGTYGG